MLQTLKRFMIGEPKATVQAPHERLSSPIALAVLSSDALSSVAYATEEILLVWSSRERSRSRGRAPSRVRSVCSTSSLRCRTVRPSKRIRRAAGRIASP